MKLVDENTVARAETAFCHELSSVMDLATIGKIFRKHYNLRVSGEVEFQDVDVVVHNGQIAFKFDYLAHAYFSMFMDRSGSFLAMEETADLSKMNIDDPDPTDCLVETKIIRDKETLLMDAIAAVINKETLAKLIQSNTRTKLSGRIDFMGARFDVYQNQSVYNLIYQGEVALSFLMDEKGRFLDFARSRDISNKDQGDEKKAEKKDMTPKTEFLYDAEKNVIESEELADEGTDLEDLDELVIEPIDDNELKGLEAIILDELDEDSQKGASN